MNPTVRFVSMLAILSMAAASTCAVDNSNNSCSAKVSYLRADQKADGSGWTLTFRVNGGNGTTHHSAGSFTYSLTYKDSNNVPTTGYTRSGPSWTAGDNADLDLTDDPMINPTDISDVRVESITSGGCV